MRLVAFRKRLLIKIYREEIIYNESKENSVSYANNGRAYLRV